VEHFIRLEIKAPPPFAFGDGGIGLRFELESVFLAFSLPNRVQNSNSVRKFQAQGFADFRGVVTGVAAIDYEFVYLWSERADRFPKGIVQEGGISD
jgi:hypothetical protein